MAIFKTDDINQFIDQFHAITNIDKRIIKNLMTLNLLHKILKNPKSISLNNNYFTIEFPKLVENYQQRIEFIFASYPLIDSNYEVLPFDDSDEIYKYKLINKKSKYHYLLTLFFCRDEETSTIEDRYISIENHIHINPQYFSDYSINLLTSVELEKYQHFIIDRLFDRDYHGTMLIEHKSKPILILNDQSYPTYTKDNFLFTEYFNLELELKKRLKIYKKHVAEIKNIYSNEIFKIFERSLLEQQMENF